MSIISQAPSDQAGAIPAGDTGRLLLALVTRLHFLAGLLIGPFVLIAALSGLLYALTPQLESRWYQELLFTDSRGPIQPLSLQVEAAQRYLSYPGALAAVRPSPGPGLTTRVMFSAPGLGGSEHWAVFVDPVTARPLGELTVYGTTGVLPLRNWLGDLHRRVFLGEWGRLYSELAASWLWLIALGGLVIWRARAGHRRRIVRRPRLRRWHSSLGLCLLVAMLFFSATGLTWSKWAGDNIAVARAAAGMGTPALNTRLDTSRHADTHAEHHAPATVASPQSPVDVTPLDQVLLAARRAGIDAGRIEVRPAGAQDRAWTVTEIDRSWPTQVDAVAIDPRSLQVVDRLEFATFPIAAKLTRWGIDAHMGSLFGWANQLVLVLTAAGVVAMVVLGYAMWWQRNTRNAGALSSGLTTIWSAMNRRGQWGVAGASMTLALAMPVFGASLMLLAVLDWLSARRRGSALFRG